MCATLGIHFYVCVCASVCACTYVLKYSMTAVSGVLLRSPSSMIDTLRGAVPVIRGGGRGDLGADAMGAGEGS